MQRLSFHQWSWVRLHLSEHDDHEAELGKWNRQLDSSDCHHYHYHRHHHHYPKCHLSIQRNQRHREKDCRQIKETAPANGSPEPIERVDNLRWCENDNDNFYDDLRIMINDDDNFYVDGQLDHWSPHLLTNGCDSGVVAGGQWGAETNLSIYQIIQL